MKKLAVKSEGFQYVEKSFKEWLDVLGYASTTVYQMPLQVRELFHYLEQRGCTQVNQITTPLIKTYYQDLKTRANDRRGGGLSNAHLNKHLQALYKFMDYLRQSGKMTLPYLEIDFEEKNTKPIEVLSVEEIKELYKVCDDYHPTAVNEAIAARDKAMLSIFYGCGLRRNEGYHLDLSDINYDRQVLHVRKGKNYKERFVPFNKTNAQVLQEYQYDYRPFFMNAKALNAFFLSVQGYRMEAQSMALRLKLLKQRSDDIDLLGKDFSLHTLRHSIATHLLAAGMGLEKISRFLGHSSLESTQVYTHLINQEDEHYL